MIIGVVKESFSGERRVALVPDIAAALIKQGHEVKIESGAGAEAGFPDVLFRDKGIEIVADRADVFSTAEVIAQVRTLGANPDAGQADLERMRSGQTVIGFSEPLTAFEAARSLAEKNINLFAMELMPRIARAQSMDALSSQATVQGYKAVLLAAEVLPRMFPMMMTAAGTIAPAKVLIIGAGVAGLQAIATARKLGGVVVAYDIRPIVKEQVESLGARFLQISLEAQGAEDKGGYAKAMDEEFYRKQRELMSAAVAQSDVVITTAAVPGKKSPVLVTGEMVAGMAPGSVVVDLAAAYGGNCELTRADETVVEHGVTILGPTNLPSTVPYHASQMYAKNISSFLLQLVKDGRLVVDMEDEITEQTLLTRGGEIVHQRVRKLLDLDASTASPAAAPGQGSST
ncbi:MAG: Re/Si-specific NAD(P)(+) transhydrogenase subunit alpha [Planctomycetota bacterium]|nr:Re/Si-specific NAD(P)(+) transhydrogenase subunit alpha [Planctomycetota bacterium]